MKRALQALFALILLGMIAVSVWATMHESILLGIPKVLREPWAAATLADAYAGFITISVWVCWRERTFLARALWTATILVLGNIAIAVYVLLALAALPEGRPWGDLFLRRGNPS